MSSQTGKQWRIRPLKVLVYAYGTLFGLLLVAGAVAAVVLPRQGVLALPIHRLQPDFGSLSYWTSPDPNNPLSLPDGVELVILLSATWSGLYSFLQVVRGIWRFVYKGISQVRQRAKA